MNKGKTIVIEPFNGGSHSSFITQLTKEKIFGEEPLILTLPAKKWKWRLRCSALYFASKLPNNNEGFYQYLFCSSMINVAELLGLRRDFAKIKVILYFHENQLEFPDNPNVSVQDKHIQNNNNNTATKNIQFGWAQLVSSMGADRVLFNSAYNQRTFLQNLKQVIKNLPPDQKSGFSLKQLENKISTKSKVIYYPLIVPSISEEQKNRKKMKENEKIHILWNHRWEWDKNPSSFFNSLIELIDKKIPFIVSVIGESFGEIPDCFLTCKKILEEGGFVFKWGFLESKEEYFDLLSQCDIVVSTAIHEFYGVSVLEAIAMGCYPLCPNRLVFPEYLDQEFLYNTDRQLVKKLINFARRPHLIRNSSFHINLTQFHPNTVFPLYLNEFNDNNKNNNNNKNESDNNNVDNNNSEDILMINEENKNEIDVEDVQLKKKRKIDN